MIAANLLSFVTRQEGKKFLRLSQEGEGGIVPLAEAGVPSEVSLYIHIPFCRVLCPFCCFNRYLFKEDKAKAYFRNLKQELDFYIQRGYRFSHVYFGGGTPTVLMDELLEFIDYLKEQFEIKEISLETTPPEITPRNVALLQEAGINRLSIGVQSFDDDILQAMGRTLCTGEEAKESLLMAQGHFDTLNADFIFNFPFQPIEKFEADIATFKDLGIDQVTFYPLMPSPHKRNALERRFQQVDNSQEKRYYDIILRDLYSQGYKASTVWCFSREERMIDEYIVDFPDYIGIGSGSVSLVKGNFYVNAFSLEHYQELIQSGRLPIIRWRRLSESEYLRYYLLTKLFGMKVDAGLFRRNFHADIHRKLRSELLFLKLAGLVEGEEIIMVTRRGMYPVNVMMRDFFTALNGLREYCIRHQI
ncbi:MAG TPA: coproporphyrinogen III oxidase family protein [Dehalococcoidia bacterium]|nr:coproporphyrinogen III oxidase family protein [Dehalococcoidia bacterium]